MSRQLIVTCEHGYIFHHGRAGPVDECEGGGVLGSFSAEAINAGVNAWIRFEGDVPGEVAGSARSNLVEAVRIIVDAVLLHTRWEIAIQEWQRGTTELGELSS